MRVEDTCPWYIEDLATSALPNVQISVVGRRFKHIIRLQTQKRYEWVS